MKTGSIVLLSLVLLGSLSMFMISEATFLVPQGISRLVFGGGEGIVVGAAEAIQERLEALEREKKNLAKNLKIFKTVETRPVPVSWLGCGGTWEVRKCEENLSSKGLARTVADDQGLLMAEAAEERLQALEKEIEALRKQLANPEIDSQDINTLTSSDGNTKGTLCANPAKVKAYYKQCRLKTPQKLGSPCECENRWGKIQGVVTDKSDICQKNGNCNATCIKKFSAKIGSPCECRGGWGDTLYRGTIQNYLGYSYNVCREGGFFGGACGLKRCQLKGSPCTCRDENGKVRFEGTVYM